MSGRLIKAQSNTHVCSPGINGADEQGRVNFVRFWFGDVWECEYGKTFVAVRSMNPGQVAPVWERESKRDRKKRLQIK